MSVHSDEEFIPDEEIEEDEDLEIHENLNNGNESEDDRMETDLDTEPQNIQGQVNRNTAEAFSEYALEGEDMAAAGERMFPIGGEWESKQDLKDVVTNYGLTFGFKICQTGWKFTCNKSGFTKDRPKPDVPVEKKRKGCRSLKVGCSMCVKFTFIENNRVAAGPVKITGTNFTHTNCTPSANQLVVCRRASGDYSNLSSTLLTTIMTLLEHDPGTSTRSLRALLREHYPSRKSISALEIFNLKVRVGLLQEDIEANGELAKTKASLLLVLRD